MFSGIVEEMGRIDGLAKKKNLYVLTVTSPQVIRKAKVSESIAVNGVCLTVTAKKGKTASFDLMKETLEATTLGGVRPGDEVNLEGALRVNDRLGGHFVTGHVDCIGTIKSITKDTNYVAFEIAVPAKLMPYIANKGSVAVDGVSLTLGRVHKSSFEIYLIPFTLEVTNLGGKSAGDTVNIETDLLAKYVLGGRDKPRGLAGK